MEATQNWEGLRPLLGHWRWGGAVGSTYLDSSPDLGFLTLNSDAVYFECICYDGARLRARKKEDATPFEVGISRAFRLHKTTYDVSCRMQNTSSSPPRLEFRWWWTWGYFCFTLWPRPSKTTDVDGEDVGVASKGDDDGRLMGDGVEGNFAVRSSSTSASTPAAPSPSPSASEHVEGGNFSFTFIGAPGLMDAISGEL